MSMDFVFLGVTVSEARPTAHMLSQRMSVVGCGYPRLSRIARRDAPSLAFINTAAYSASATDDTTTGTMVLRERHGPLIVVG